MADFHLIDASPANFEAPTHLIWAYFICFCLLFFISFLERNERRLFFFKYIANCESFACLQVANIFSNVYITCFMQPYLFFPLIGGRSVGLLSTNFHISFHTLTSLMIFFVSLQLSLIVFGFLSLTRSLRTTIASFAQRNCSDSFYNSVKKLFYALPFTLSILFYIGYTNKSVQMEMIQQNYTQFENTLKNKSEFDVYQFEPQQLLFGVALALTLILTSVVVIYCIIEINSVLSSNTSLALKRYWKRYKYAFFLFKLYALFLPFCIGCVVLLVFVRGMKNSAGRWLAQLPFLFFAAYPVFSTFTSLFFAVYLRSKNTLRREIPIEMIGMPLRSGYGVG